MRALADHIWQSASVMLDLTDKNDDDAPDSSVDPSRHDTSESVSAPAFQALCTKWEAILRSNPQALGQLLNTCQKEFGLGTWPHPSAPSGGDATLIASTAAAGSTQLYIFRGLVRLISGLVPALDADSPVSPQDLARAAEASNLAGQFLVQLLRPLLESIQVRTQQVHSAPVHH